MSRGSDSEGSMMESMSGTPYSSPLQQVPGTGSNLAYPDDICLHIQGKKPYLKIIIQPQDQFRFRYKSESGTHGCLRGKVSANDFSKTYPTVELRNYYGRAKIKCRLYENIRNVEHLHQPLEDENSVPCAEVPLDGSYIVCFQGLGIVYKAKKDIPKLLYSKMEKRMSKEAFKKINKKELRDQLKKEAELINLNIVRLRFSAHDVITDNEICEPVFSEPIYNSKSLDTNELRICDSSTCSGDANSTTRIILLVDKIQKDKVRLNIFEYDANGERKDLRFIPLNDANVHCQCAIVFDMPRYRDPEIVEPAVVHIELHRVTDGRRSKPLPFTYRPAPASLRRIMAARKRKFEHSPASSSPSVSGESTASLKENVSYNIQTPQSNHNVQIVQENLMAINDIDMSKAMEIPLTAQELFQLKSGYGEEFNQFYHKTAAHSSEAEIWPEILDANKTNYVNYEACLNSDKNPMLSQTIQLYPAAPAAPPALSVVNDLPDQYEITLLNELDMQAYGEYFQPDSGRPSRSKELSKKIELKPEKDLVYFKAEDAQEVKKLIKELYDLKTKDGSKDWVPEAKQKLQRLFEIRRSNGDTFAHMALGSGQLASLEWTVGIVKACGLTPLLDAGDGEQLTVLHLAVLLDLPHTVAYLIQNGCDPLCADLKGDTVIHYAAKRESCLRALLDAIKKRGDKYDLDPVNHEKETPLHVAAACGSSANVLALLGAGAGAGAGGLLPDRHGSTALHLCAEQCDVASLRALLTHAPSAGDACNWKQMTPLQIACAGDVRENTLEIIQLLLEKGANPFKHEGNTKPAWQYAKRHPTMWEVMRKFIPASKLTSDGLVAGSSDGDVGSSEGDDGASDGDDGSSEDDDDFLSADEGDSDSSEMDLTTKLEAVTLKEEILTGN